MKSHVRSFVPSVLVAFFCVVVVSERAEPGGLSFVEVQRDGVGGVDGLAVPRAVAVSPDGAHVYVGGQSDQAVAVFSRNPATGALSFVEAEQVGGAALASIAGIALSPDGAHLYTAVGFGVGVFSRNATTGELTFVEVQLDDGSAGGSVPGLRGVTTVAVSPDGAHVYAIGNVEDSLVVFSRNAVTGALTHVETELDGVGGVSGIRHPRAVTLSPDGAHVYVAAQPTVAVFTRNPVTGAVTFVEFKEQGVDGVDGINKPRGITTSPDGLHVYVAGQADDAIAVFSRNVVTGSLTFIETIVDGGVVDGLHDIYAVALSPDGAYVYAAGNGDNAASVFRRNATTGGLTFLEVHKDGKLGVDGIKAVGALALSPDGSSLYAAGSGEDAVAVFAADRCGNGAVGADEQCDDGNLSGGDGCSASCKLELCASTPAPGCRKPETGKGFVHIKDKEPDAKDNLIWKWTKGAATTVAQYGNPLSTTSYALCVYDSSAAPQPLLSLAAPAGGTCAGGPCWSAPNATQFKYKDKLRTPDGLGGVSLKEGLADGKAKITFTGKGMNLLLPPLGLTTPVTVQVKNTETGVCWDAVYSTAIQNDAAAFKASSD